VAEIFHILLYTFHFHIYFTLSEIVIITEKYGILYYVNHIELYRLKLFNSACFVHKQKSKFKL